MYNKIIYIFLVINICYIGLYFVLIYKFSYIIVVIYFCFWDGLGMYIIWAYMEIFFFSFYYLKLELSSYKQNTVYMYTSDNKSPIWLLQNKCDIALNYTHATIISVGIITETYTSIVKTCSEVYVRWKAINN